MNGGGDSNRGQHGFFVHTFFAQHFFVGVDADSAAVDGRNGETPQFEVHRIAAVPADHLHAQARRHGGVLFVAAEVAEAVEDVVHPHDGRGGLGGEHRLFVEMRGGFRQEALEELRIARGDGAGNHGAPGLLLGQFGLPGDAAEVELQILGVLRHMIQ